MLICVLVKMIRFIGTLDSTIADFWRMVWQERCGKIVMLANLEEWKRVCFWSLNLYMLNCLIIIISLLLSNMCKKYLISKETSVEIGAQYWMFLFNKVWNVHCITWYRKSVPSTGQTRARWHMVALKWTSTRRSHIPTSSSEHLLYQRYTVSSFQNDILR